MSLANPTNTANAPQQQPVYPHPGNASYVINGQEPFTTVGMPVTGEFLYISLATDTATPKIYSELIISTETETLFQSSVDLFLSIE